MTEVPAALDLSSLDADSLRALATVASAEAARRERAIADAELARREARKPKMPELGGAGDRAVVAFSRYLNGREYNYAAVGWRVGRAVRWTVTGETSDRFNWPGLLAFIGEANWPTLHLMTEDKLLGPPPGDEAPVAEHMGSFGRVMSTEQLGGGYARGGEVRGPFR